MKTFLQTLLVLSAPLIGSASGETIFNKEQVIQMGHIILAAPENKNYKDVFWDAQPEYDTKTNLWAYKNGWPKTPGGAFYTFEFREADGSYRLAWSNVQKSSPGYERFRIQPSIRKKLIGLLNTFNNP